MRSPSSAARPTRERDRTPRSPILGNSGPSPYPRNACHRSARAIADLDDQLNAAPAGADTSEMIIDAYSAMVDDVPSRDPRRLPVRARRAPGRPERCHRTSPPTLEQHVVVHHRRRVAGARHARGLRGGLPPRRRRPLTAERLHPVRLPRQPEQPGPARHRTRSPAAGVDRRSPDAPTLARAPAPTISSTTVRGHVPRCARRSASRQAGGRDGRDRMDADLRRARRRRQSAEQAVPVGRPATRRPRRVLPREPPALHRDPVGLRVRRADLHRGLVASHHRRADLHRQRLRRPCVHHLHVQGRSGRGAASTPRPTSSCG